MMSKSPELLEYDKVAEQTSGGRSHLLLGNGFSIACDEMFRYDKLYEFAKDNGLNDRVMGVFEYLGTNNFEGVMRLLEDSDWIARHYGLLDAAPGDSTPFADDLESVKQALLVAITKTHLDQPNEIEEQRRDRCVDFLRPYQHIFTTNYDLLLYWIEMHDRHIRGRDGFLSDQDDPDAPYVVFSEHIGDRKGIFFIHGALHLYTAAGQVRKHTWVRTGKRLIDSVRESLQNDQYPMFVAEGSSPKKLEQIRRSGYLSYCLEKLGRVENALVVFGLSFGASDQHIADVITRNQKLSRMYVGLFGDPESPANSATRQQVRMMQDQRLASGKGSRQNPLEVDYFDSGTARVWD